MKIFCLWNLINKIILNVKILLLMLLLKVVGMLLKYMLNELAIISGSLIMMSFNLMEVLNDLPF